MSGVGFCGSCGVPEMIGRDLIWEKNGVITVASSPGNRMVMFECEPIDGLFCGIGDLIGLPVEHIVIESRSRETRRFTERTFPPSARAILEGKGGRQEGEGLVDIGRVFGYGDQYLTHQPILTSFPGGRQPGLR